MGAISAVMRYGSEAQKRLAARLVLDGDKPAICITEPEAGSAATEMTTRADRRGRLLGAERPQALDHRRRRVEAASDLRAACSTSGARAAASAGSSRCAATAKDCVGRREPTMGLRGIPETEIIFDNLGWTTTWCCAAAGRGFARPDERLQQPARRRGDGGARPGAGRVRAGAGVGQGAPPVRPADRRVPGAAMDAGRHGDPAQCGAAGDSSRPRPAPTRSPIRCWRRRRRCSPRRWRSRSPTTRCRCSARAAIRATCRWSGWSRDARMFTIGGGTAQVLRTLVAGRLLGWKLPQTRDGYAPKPSAMPSLRDAAE